MRLVHELYLMMVTWFLGPRGKKVSVGIMMWKRKVIELTWLREK